uniref:Putative salivary gland metalloprotease n=1 Tax=Rhipicephalus microplus TaxID=6941 RepID=A0A6G5A5L6_RHIMP
MKHSTPILFLVFVEFTWLIQASRVVYPRMLESRADNGAKVLKISEDITLNLRKSSVFSEEFLIHTTHDGEPIAYHMNGAEMEKNLYDDHEQMATVHVSQEDGLSVEGVLGHTLRIRPLEGTERSTNGLRPHELFHVSEPQHDDHRRDDYGPPDTNTTQALVESRLMWVRAPRLPLLINPEVYVVVDFYICKALKFDEKKIARYVAIMTGSANLRYRSVVQPRVQLVLVGITVTKSRGKRNEVVITIDVADSTCKRFPRYSWHFHCKPQANSHLYICRGRALVRNGVQFVKFLRAKCWRNVCRKPAFIDKSV